MIGICIFVIHQNLIIMSKPILVISNERLISLYMSLYDIAFLPPEFLNPSSSLIEVIRNLVSRRLDELSSVERLKLFENEVYRLPRS